MSIPNSPEARVKKIIMDTVCCDESEITPDANLTEDLGIDSLDTVEILMNIEKEFNFAIPDEDASSLTTLAKIMEYLKAKKVI